MPSSWALALQLTDSTWELRRKLRDSTSCEGDGPDEKGKAHLCKLNPADAQARSFAQDPQPEPRGADGFQIQAELLKPGVNEFLMRCSARTDGSRACPADRLQLIALDLRQLPYEATLVATRNVEIRPFRELTSVVSVRANSAYNDDPDSAHYRVAMDVRPEPGWKDGSPGQIPTTAKQVTLVVHGFNVADAEFKEAKRYTADSGCLIEPWQCPWLPGWFATWAKRLYWAGHPVIEAQDAFTVGVAWPGDVPGLFNPALFYPEDEFHALQAGLPVGRYIASLRTSSQRKLNIFAHSLGNMVVNNALKEVPSSGAVVNYVMNDAAISSEAFLGQYNPLDPVSFNVPGVPDLVEHAQELGYPDPQRNRPNPDQEFFYQEAQIESDRASYGCPTSPPFPPSSDSPECQFVPPDGLPPLQCSCDLVTRYFASRLQVNSALGPLEGAATDRPQTPYFERRWSRLPRNNDGSVPGAWTRFFLPNTPAQPRSDVRIFNTYNRDDYVLRINDGLPWTRFWEPHAWRYCQLKAKPFDQPYEVPLTGFQNATDPVEKQRWWTLTIAGRPSPWRSIQQTAEEQNALWGNLVPFVDEGAPPTTDERSRQWAELALWYPALAPAAGAFPLANLSGPSSTLVGLPVAGRNIDFTSVGGSAPRERGSSVSHSYLYAMKLHQVWKGFRAIRELFATP